MDRNYCGFGRLVSRSVAPREGGVDRNSDPDNDSLTYTAQGAPRAGGVDRNNDYHLEHGLEAVAPREGGVDRNSNAGQVLCRAESPPARGAWIATR